MSFMSYLRKGIDLEDKIYNRFNSVYPQDQVKPLMASGCYKGEVTQAVVSNQHSQRILDRAIEISTVGESLRLPKLKFWKKYKVQSLRLGIGGIGTAILGISFGIAASAAALGTTATAAAGVVTITGIALLILGFYRRQQAQAQYQAWQDPLAGYQALRQKVAQEGFPFVFSQRLKGALIHPEECCQLWGEWSDRQMHDYQDIQFYAMPARVEKIKQFFEHNPLETAAMKYAFEGLSSTPAYVQSLSALYQQMKASYVDIRLQAAKAEKEVHQERDLLLRENEEKRQRWLSSAQQAKEVMILSARTQYDQDVQHLQGVLPQQIREVEARFSNRLRQKRRRIAQVQNTYLNHPTVKNAQTVYQSRCAMYELFYQAAVAPIQLQLDENKRRITAWSKERLEAIGEKEKSRIRDFALEVQGLALAYIQAKSNYLAQEKRQQEQLSQHLEGSALRPSADHFTWTDMYYYMPPSAPPLDD